MGLTKAVRDFFTQRIYRLLDAKMAVIYNAIDEEKVKKEATKRFCKKWGLKQEVLARWQQIQDEQKALEEEKNDIEHSIEKVLLHSKNHERSYWSKSKPEDVEKVADKDFRNEVLADLYPEAVPELEKLQKIKDEVEGTVLLATTESKLVSRLTSVLTKYGGSIEELLEYIPQEEYK
jgi:uncharacterized damage-inducible protein DinB